jgi:HEAT repeat protein
MTAAAIAAALRAIAKDARRPIEATEDPDALLRAIAAQLERLAVLAETGRPTEAAPLRAALDSVVVAAFALDCRSDRERLNEIRRIMAEAGL